MNEIKSFTIYSEFFKLINTLKPIEKRDKFFGKLCDYYFKDIEPTFDKDSDEEAIWENISKPIIKYKTNAINGLKGGRSKSKKETQNISEAETETETQTGTQTETQSITQTESTSNDVNVNVNSNMLNVNVNKKRDRGMGEEKKEILDKKHILELFDEFWKEYPRRKNKTKAREWYLKNLKSEELHSNIMFALMFFVHEDWKNKEEIYIPFPTTWLNQKRWEDYLT